MKIEYDPTKNERNIRERQLAFDRVNDFDFETAVYSEDRQRDYGEVRLRALGLLDGRVHALVFVETPGGIRVISFRKANQREVKHYERAQAQS